MATVGAPIGSQNAAKGRMFEGAIKRALHRDDGAALNRCAIKLIEQAEAGEAWAMQMLADRLDGKPKQVVIAQGDDEGGPMLIRVIERVIVDSASSE